MDKNTVRQLKIKTSTLKRYDLTRFLINIKLFIEIKKITTLMLRRTVSWRLSLKYFRRTMAMRQQLRR